MPGPGGTPRSARLGSARLAGGGSAGALRRQALGASQSIAPSSVGLLERSPGLPPVVLQRLPDASGATQAASPPRPSRTSALKAAPAATTAAAPGSGATVRRASTTERLASTTPREDAPAATGPAARTPADVGRAGATTAPDSASTTDPSAATSAPAPARSVRRFGSYVRRRGSTTPWTSTQPSLGLATSRPLRRLTETAETITPASPTGSARSGGLGPRPGVSLPARPTVAEPDPAAPVRRSSVPTAGRHRAPGDSSGRTDAGSTAATGDGVRPAGARAGGARTGGAETTPLGDSAGTGAGSTSAPPAGSTVRRTTADTASSGPGSHGAAAVRRSTGLLATDPTPGSPSERPPAFRITPGHTAPSHLAPGSAGPAMAMPDQLVARRTSSHGRGTTGLARGFGVDEPIQPAAATAPGGPRPGAAGAASTVRRRPADSGSTGADPRSQTARPSGPGTTAGLGLHRWAARPGSRSVDPTASGSTSAAPGAAAPAGADGLRRTSETTSTPTSAGAGSDLLSGGPAGAAASIRRRFTVAPPRVSVARPEPVTPGSSTVGARSSSSATPAPPAAAAAAAALGAPAATGPVVPAVARRLSTTAGSGVTPSLLDSSAHLFDRTPATVVRRLLSSPEATSMSSRGSSTADNPSRASRLSGWQDQPGPETEQESPEVMLDRLVDAVVEKIEERVVDELERRGRRQNWTGI